MNIPMRDMRVAAMPKLIAIASFCSATRQLSAWPDSRSRPGKLENCLNLTHDVMSFSRDEALEKLVGSS